jgi:hypothetical protein
LNGWFFLIRNDLFQLNSFSYLSDLPTDVNRFEIEDDRKIYQELRSVCNFSEEFEELKYI